MAAKEEVFEKYYKLALQVDDKLFDMIMYNLVLCQSKWNQQSRMVGRHLGCSCIWTTTSAIRTVPPQCMDLPLGSVQGYSFLVYVVTLAAIWFFQRVLP